MINEDELYTFAEIEHFIIQLKNKIKNTTINPKPLLEYYNNAKVIKIIKRNYKINIED